jgi:hypothetical protein
MPFDGFYYGQRQAPRVKHPPKPPKNPFKGKR